MLEGEERVHLKNYWKKQWLKLHKFAKRHKLQISEAGQAKKDRPKKPIPKTHNSKTSENKEKNILKQ